MKDEITEDTKINVRIGLIWTSIIAITFLVFSIAVVYAEHRDLPDKVRKLERRSNSNCYILKNIQENTVPSEKRIIINCEDL